MHAVGDRHGTPDSRPSLAPTGLGADVSAQARPSQCSASGTVAVPWSWVPTAVRLAGPAQDTAASWLKCEPAGLGMGAQPVPAGAPDRAAK